MRAIVFILGLLFFFNANAFCADDTLRIERDGLVVSVVDFQEGDKLKLFEVESGDHILSKTRGQIDLSMLPVGKYLLENSEGKSVVIEKTNEALVLEEALGDEYVVSDSERDMNGSADLAEELGNYYVNSESNILNIEREGDIITVVDFAEGDKIKLFEVKYTVHILSKSVGIVDLSQLPVGKYVLENNKGESIVVEKFEEELNEEYSEVVE
ncbi:hypothetical protein [Aquimarina sp. 2201CG5-10]|uniref:hypothetical protein n=1 Tax=Aquimarina callyspongiae TaxID=3098150 RepID=UPI002AB4E3C1|nr:hypothetical protein [Aquimarina sp. 2201CG5-10]MDY8134103.1 hypothetical protein [Aquimarina sp. 2201CG5-10]